jgi:hypothetical protein
LATFGVFGSVSKPIKKPVHLDDDVYLDVNDRCKFSLDDHVYFWDLEDKNWREGNIAALYNPSLITVKFLFGGYLYYVNCKRAFLAKFIRSP